MLGALYKSKKELKSQIGKRLNYIETSLFGKEYKPTGTFNVVGPDPYSNRSWFAAVTMKDDLIVSVE